MTQPPQDPVARTAAMFDGIAPSYDQSGVPFFGTIAGGLVDLLAPRPGERALDVGAGRGAVTLPVAEAVGPQGRVDAIDVSPGRVIAILRHHIEVLLREFRCCPQGNT